MPLDNQILYAMKDLRSFLVTAYTEKSKIVSDIKSGRGNASDLTDFNESFYPDFYHKLEGLIGLIEKDPQLAKNLQVKNLVNDILSEAGLSNDKAEQILDKMEFGTDSNKPSPY